MLNRRHADGRHLPHATDVAADFDVLELREAHLVPSRAITDLAFGRVTAAAAFPALHLGDGSAYLCGRDEAGRATTFDIGSGVASAVDPAYLPHSTRWRVMVPEAGGLATVFEAGPA
ncbi:hypothetical protein [Methylobacterium sp. NEAU K]|uniref:hypothetical protein n=1 Tax=Methylobacterium sp. NEAU K TaxID=3064946 RepID=UPI002732CC40|nr:hypothetical protein [Methylobacterium sp. NEAU K]MDP4005891.1 hypothetical protein [Methylobacterium sp. NEAU K]